ncbi:iron complex transport system substrate-binding protein [Lentzea atacamensis]|uniref:Iron complex transport system substrate-binding protein n=2 Tax=Lentzea TaxID=165301 RepID=A0A316I8N5_9PSEU|nr:iron-siderophore ABC transporter substrate-binding protein [Lentzea atacamensis]PWK89409.1 iron complex transport system substrate-binding protein [Lentzea atacamensis]RAS60743.1 iron complex transport system substrate-binding protein [Lentzea atacamensis]
MSKRAALLAAVALVLAACGQSTDKPTVAQGGEDFGKAYELSNGFGTQAKPGEFPRTIKHAMGETKLEKKPERVIVLDTGELDNVAALGIKPVGIAFTDGSPTMPSYIGDKGGQPENVGTINNLNLEAITKLNPDLILGSKLRAESLYPKLSAIAPTVFSVRPGYVWKENFLLNAAALDRQADAAKMLEDYTNKATATGAAIEKKLGVRPTVTALRFMPGKIRLYAKKSFIGTILIDAKIPQPTPSQVDDLAAEVSAEQIGKADGDFIIYSTYGDPAKTEQASVLGGPLWSGLNAVKAGKAKPVLDETYFLGLGVLAANVVLDDLQKQLGA